MRRIRDIQENACLCLSSLDTECLFLFASDHTTICYTHLAKTNTSGRCLTHKQVQTSVFHVIGYHDIEGKFLFVYVFVNSKH